METWGTFLCYFVAVLAISWLLVSTLWVSRAAEKEQKAKEEWFEKRLAKTDWKVERDVRPLRSLDIPPGCRRQYPRWSQVRLVSVCKSDQWTGWFFRLKPVLVSVKYDVVMCVLQSSRFDFPRITLKNKVHLRRWFPPRSSGHINDFYPSLCQHWVVHTQDEGQRTLSLLADLKEVLQQVRHTATVELAPDYVAISGEPLSHIELREQLFEFVRELRCILESIGEPDPFDGAFGSSGLPRKHL